MVWIVKEPLLVSLFIHRERERDMCSEPYESDEVEQKITKETHTMYPKSEENNTYTGKDR